MNYLHPLDYLFNGESWVKKLFILIVTNLFFLPTAPIYAGYQLAIVRSRGRHDEKLPDLEVSVASMASLFVDGLRLLLQFLVAFLPVVALVVGAACLAYCSENSMHTVYRVWAILGIAFIFFVLALLAVPAIYILAARDGSWLTVFKLRPMLDLVQAHFDDYLRLVIVSFIYRAAAVLTGSVIAGLGNILTAPMAGLCICELYGQYAGLGSRAGATEPADLSESAESVSAQAGSVAETERGLVVNAGA